MKEKENNVEFIVKIIVVLIIIYAIISYIFYPGYFINNCIKNSEMDANWEIMKIKGEMGDINKQEVTNEELIKQREELNAQSNEVINNLQNFDSSEICKEIFNEIPLFTRIYISLTWDKEEYRPPG